MKTKPKFKKGETFLHPIQKVFVVIDNMAYYEGKGWLYNLMVFNHGVAEAVPWKRYYESRVMTELTQMTKANTAKVLYGSKGV